MKIVQYEPEMSVDRMYCPSTDEVIFAPYYESINDDAEAFIAYWHGEVLDQPKIKDEKLKAAWDKYFSKWNESDDIDIFEAIEKFLKKYKNEEWIVYECTFYGMACGPTSTTIYFVVIADTLIEEDPEPIEDPMKDLTDEEIENEIISRQIKAILSAKSEEQILMETIH